jgi:hypothetical protein
MGCGTSSYDDYPYDDRYSYRTRGYEQPNRYQNGRQTRHTVEEHRIGREQRPPQTVQHHTRTMVTERRSVTPPQMHNTVVHREVRVTDDKPTETIIRRSPVQTEHTVVRRSPVQTERVVHEYTKHNQVDPGRVVVHKYDDRPIRNTYSRISGPPSTSSHDSWRQGSTTVRYYEDRNPASWYKRERSAQRQRLNDTVDKRHRHEEVVNSLYREGTAVYDPAYRSSWTRQN